MGKALPGNGWRPELWSRNPDDVSGTTTRLQIGAGVLKAAVNGREQRRFLMGQ